MFFEYKRNFAVKKITLAVVFMLTILATGIFAQTWATDNLLEEYFMSIGNARIPELYFDLDTCFLAETAEWLSLLYRIDRKILKLPLGGWYDTGYYSLRTPLTKDEDSFTLYDFSLYSSYNFAINENFSIPLILSAVGSNYDRYSTESSDGFFFGTGLIYTSRFGIIGAFTGFKSTVEFEKKYSTYDGEIYSWYEKSENATSFPFYIVPLLNTKDYPVIGLALEKIIGFLGIKTGGISAYSVTLISHALNLQSFGFDFEIYHNKQNYNYEAGSRNYGLRINTTLKFGFDVGYRQYLNASGDSYNYDDSVYLKLIYIPPEITIGRLYASFDNNYFPLPKIGWEFSIPLLSATLSFGYSKNFLEFSLAVKFYL